MKKKHFVLAIYIFTIPFLTRAESLENSNITSISLEEDLSQVLMLSDAINPDFDLVDDFTLESWIKIESSIPPGTWATIIGKSKGGSSPDRGYGWYLQEKDGYKQIILEAHTNNTVEGDVAVSVPWEYPMNEWHHVAVSRDGASGEVTFYLDGFVVAAIDSGATGALNNSNQDFQIGRLYNEDPFSFDGLLDEVRVWNSVRTQSEIFENYKKEISVQNNLIGYWMLNETLTSSSNNSSNLQNPNGATFSSDVPFSTYDDIDEDPDVYELLHTLIQSVEEYDFPTSIENGYTAHLKKVENFLNNAQYTPAENQMLAFLKKLDQDYEKGLISEEQYSDLYAQVQKILEGINAFTFGTVPLVTQIISPYPSLDETATWAPLTYAGGRANAPGDCGLTIAQCGCAITSLGMLGKYYGITTDIQGNAVNPKNMNNWLLTGGVQKGYDAVGNTMWAWALAYLGEEKNGKYMSKLSIDTLNLKSDEAISDTVKDNGPALAFSVEKGHYFVLTDTLEDGGYSINDPLWYNTKTTNDVRNVGGKVQDYNDVVSKAHTFAYSSTLKPVQEILHISVASPVELLATDEQGRRVGYDPETGTLVNEIAGASYEQEEFILNPDEPSDNPHKTKHIILIEPEGSVFDVQVIGTGDGSYTLTSGVSDGTGGIFGRSIAEEINLDDIDRYTITTQRDTNMLPVYLQDILLLIPASEQKKFIQAFHVIYDQTEKDHVVVTETLIQNLIRYIEQKYTNTVWAASVITALEAL